jgi:PIN domain nuclease of toxin-antitoxin system
MKGPLDTHEFIWWDSDPSRLSAPALACLQNPSSTVLLNVVSVWEMVIKLQLGKLTLSTPLRTILAQQQANGLQILPLTLDHVLAVEGLPTPHKDPFDRLLIAQANVEGAVLLSADAIFAQYPVQVLW